MCAGNCFLGGSAELRKDKGKRREEIRRSSKHLQELACLALRGHVCAVKDFTATSMGLPRGRAPGHPGAVIHRPFTGDEKALGQPVGDSRTCSELQTDQPVYYGDICHRRDCTLNCPL